MSIALKSNAIIDLATAQVYLDNSSSDADDLHHLGINVVSALFDSFCGYQLIEKAYSAVRLNGTGSDLLRFNVRNVTAITLLEYRSSRSNYTELSTTLYEVDDVNRLGAIGFGGYTFSRGVNNYRTSFTSGWTQTLMPGTILDAFFKEFKRFVEKRGDLTAENLRGQATKGRTYANLREETIEALTAYQLQRI